MDETVVNRPDVASVRPRPITIVACVSMLAGLAGMVLSFDFLASTDALDVTAGAAGFVAGAILVAAAIVSLAILKDGAEFTFVARQLLVAMIGMAPSAVACLSWPVLYFGFFLFGLFAMPIILIVCGFAAVGMSGWTAQALLALFSPNADVTAQLVKRLRISVICLQLLLILASYPLFLLLLAYLESQGVKVGWS